MDKNTLIKQTCLTISTDNPFIILDHLFQFEGINMHGPEHHVLDGCALLSALYNHGLKFNLNYALDEMIRRGTMMPGATCGHWGICGSVSSLGAALSIFHQTGPLSSDLHYKNHMKFTSAALQKISETGGPRCCKRNAWLSMKTAVKFLKEVYSIDLPDEPVKCTFSHRNAQCIHKQCPFHNKIKVAFVCVHNSCRSQMAEALLKHYDSELFDVYSAGTETKPQINQDAVRLVKSTYNIDMSTHYSKLITDIPNPDILITMGCNVQCPSLPCIHREDWGLSDPTGQDDETFIKTIQIIDKKVHQLIQRYKKC